MDDLSLVRFHCANFYNVLLNSRPFHPIDTNLLKIVNSLILSIHRWNEPKDRENFLARINFIKDNTHYKIGMPLAIIELAVYRNIYRELSKEITIDDQTFLLAELYNCLDEMKHELNEIVMHIAKDYSVDIPFLHTGGSSSSTLNFN